MRIYADTGLRQVTVFRESEDRGYGFMRAPEIFDFIAVAAYARPQLIGETKKVFKLRVVLIEIDC